MYFLAEQLFKNEMRVVTSDAAWCPVSHKNELESWMPDQFKHPVSTKGVL